MKLIIGLGNPGSKYVNNRHNVGHMFIKLLEDSEIGGKLILKRTDTYMNSSGVFVRKMVNKYNTNLNNLFVVHDDLDLRIGEYKVQFGKGPKIHNGLKSIHEALGTDNYWHVRIGVDNRDLVNRPSGEEYVLSDFTFDEKQKIENIFQEIVKKIVTI